ncbi:MAG TPA: hypothetical protein VGC18_00450 [Lacisediminihabitans sp.]|uniref:hypothetical protein n=1 Tax=Lacisediminihabitans sp. TaxID=2787631 RepID=UPI002ED78F80
MVPRAQEDDDGAAVAEVLGRGLGERDGADVSASVGAGLPLPWIATETPQTTEATTAPATKATTSNGIVCLFQ